MTLNLDDNCIDIGANQGSVLAEMLRAAPQGQHVAIEPIPELAAELQSRFASVDVRSVALSDTDGKAEFEIIDDAKGLSSLCVGRDLARFGERARRLIHVDVRRLDDLIPDSYQPRVIKIDVEGNELAVLRGAVRTLRRSRPILIFEHDFRDHTESSSIWRLVCEDIRYRLFDIDGNGPLGHDEFLQVLEHRMIWNWVAHP